MIGYVLLFAALGGVAALYDFGKWTTRQTDPGVYESTKERVFVAYLLRGVVVGGFIGAIIAMA